MLRLFKKKQQKFDIEAFIAGSVKGMQLVTEAHKKAWRLGQEKSWSVDEKKGKIIFSFSDGIQASAQAQIVGTFNTKDNTFMWGWGHPSVSQDLQRHAARVKVFGEQYGSEELTTKEVQCTEARAWEYTALAMLLSEANGAYRVLVGSDTAIFMTFGEVALDREQG